jgi:hypothetical protein
MLVPAALAFRHLEFFAWLGAKAEVVCAKPERG